MILINFRRELEETKLLNMDEASAIKKRKRNNDDGELNSKKKDVRSCDQCDYTGSRTALYRHKQSKHEGIRYPCDQCIYTAGD